MLVVVEFLLGHFISWKLTQLDSDKSTKEDAQAFLWIVLECRSWYMYIYSYHHTALYKDDPSGFKEGTFLILNSVKGAQSVPGE